MPESLVKAAEGARLVVFPAAFLPARLAWVHEVCRARTRLGTSFRTGPVRSQQRRTVQ
jgi:hypothetical protein